MTKKKQKATPLLGIFSWMDKVIADEKKKIEKGESSKLSLEDIHAYETKYKSEVIEDDK